MKVHVSMIVRNEADRHLRRALESARQILDETGGELIVTDDCSEDDGATVRLLQEYGAILQQQPRPLFWEHEGHARQLHQQWLDQYASPGDWVLALDGDETVNRPELVLPMARLAENGRWTAVGMPLYEFWSETQYRTDGFWFGTQATRLYQWRDEGQIGDRAMGSGSEPTYVRSAVLARGYFPQEDLHLMHWGYLNPLDRQRKHRAYSERLGGHGHNNAHVESIVGVPELAVYGG